MLMDGEVKENINNKEENDRVRRCVKEIMKE